MKYLCIDVSVNYCFSVLLLYSVLRWLNVFYLLLIALPCREVVPFHRYWFDSEGEWFSGILSKKLPEGFLWGTARSDNYELTKPSWISRWHLCPPVRRLGSASRGIVVLFVTLADPKVPGDTRATLDKQLCVITSTLFEMNLTCMRWCDLNFNCLSTSITSAEVSSCQNKRRYPNPIWPTVFTFRVFKRSFCEFMTMVSLHVHK